MVKEVYDIFKRISADRKSIVSTVRVRPETELLPPHIVRMEKGVVPTYMKSSPYQMFCWRTLGGFVKKNKKSNPKLEDDLLKAQMKIRPEEYIAFTYMTAIIITIAAVVGGLILIFLPIGEFIIRLIIGILIMALVPLMGFFILQAMPSMKAKSRARDIDARISSAMCFISAMASADVNVDVIFKELARQPVYGEIKNESARITRDTELLGVDILTAIRNASQRTPSTKFQDFLQGVVTTSTSGGQLKPYFLIKADQFEKEAKLDMRKKIEALGLLAESFVVVVVAFPLFLVVILAIMVVAAQSNPDIMLNILYMVILALLPVAQFGFIFTIWNMSQEV
jgi:flagellar protein FlaJ